MVGQAVEQRQQEASLMGANPIRKVVTMLQAMEKKVTAEGETEEGLFKKFMCYCNSGGGSLEKSIADAGVKVPQVASEIEAGEAKHAQLQEDLKTHRVDRDAAKSAMASATAVREKEAGEFAKEKSDAETNIAALTKATAAVEAGVAGFVQTGAAQVLRTFVSSNQKMDDSDRDQVLAFLSNDQSSGYSPKSGEITGILKQMGDEMAAGLADATATENAAIASYDGLMATKQKEVALATEAIEAKTVRVGELAVEIVQMKNDLSETEEALLEDKKFLANLESACKSKTAEWEERCKVRSEELLALADTIKILNDDDALELFKKTLPGASASFMQVQQNSAALRTRALAMLRDLRGAGRPNRAQIDFIALALHGKKIGFDKVIKMIDDMVVLLKTEQQDDDHKKEDCNKQLDLADDKKKGLERSIADTETAIANLDESIATTASEIAALQESIKALDKSVAEATENRKEENEEYTELMASDSAAKELIGFAKNRMQKFYNPSLYKAPPKRVLSEEERLYVASGGTLDATAAPGGIAGTGVTVLAEVRMHSDDKADPGPAPETFSGGKPAKQETSGVMAMMDFMVKDLDKEMQIAETDEKDAQADYETFMTDSKEKRTTDSKVLTEKEATKAEMESDLESKKESKTSLGKELGATKEYINALHSDCDFLLKYFDVRKEARDSEIDALGKAKAVLSGADFSLLQSRRSSRAFLARA